MRPVELDASTVTRMSLIAVRSVSQECSWRTEPDVSAHQNATITMLLSTFAIRVQNLA